MDGREPPRFTSSEPPSMMVVPNSYGSGTGVLGHSMAIPMSASTRIPLNSLTSSTPNPLDNSSTIYSSGDSVQGMRSEGIFNMGDLEKKKRGRPKKYGPNGSMSLALCPMSSSEHSTPLSQTAAKRRGRPPGSGRKQQLEALGSPGTSFIPHVITVKAGEDVASKIMAFLQQGPRTVCILSANGAVCNVTLRQSATSGGTVTYEGRFEIISLSGSFLLAENDSSRSRTGGLSVALAGSDGRVLGGGVAGMLMAATPVQVVVGSFIAERKKQKTDPSTNDPSSVPPQMPGFGAPSTSSPQSQGSLLSGSDGEQGNHINHGSEHSNPHLQGLSHYSIWPHSED